MVWDCRDFIKGVFEAMKGDLEFFQTLDDIMEEKLTEEWWNS